MIDPSLAPTIVTPVLLVMQTALEALDSGMLPKVLALFCLAFLAWLFTIAFSIHLR